MALARLPYLPQAAANRPQATKLGCVVMCPCRLIKWHDDGICQMTYYCSVPALRPHAQHPFWACCGGWGHPNAGEPHRHDSLCVAHVF